MREGYRGTLVLLMQGVSACAQEVLLGPPRPRLCIFRRILGGVARHARAVLPLVSCRRWDGLWGLRRWRWRWLWRRLRGGLQRALWPFFSDVFYELHVNHRRGPVKSSPVVRGGCDRGPVARRPVARRPVSRRSALPGARRSLTLAEKGMTAGWQEATEAIRCAQTCLNQLTKAQGGPCGASGRQKKPHSVVVRARGGPSAAECRCRERGARQVRRPQRSGAAHRRAGPAPAPADGGERSGTGCRRAPSLAAHRRRQRGRAGRRCRSGSPA